MKGFLVHWIVAKGYFSPSGCPDDPITGDCMKFVSCGFTFFILLDIFEAEVYYRLVALSNGLQR